MTHNPTHAAYAAAQVSLVASLMKRPIDFVVRCFCPTPRPLGQCIEAQAWSSLALPCLYHNVYDKGKDRYEAHG